MDTTTLHHAYLALLDAATTVTSHGAPAPAPVDGQWDAEQVLAHVALVDAATLAAACAIAAGHNTTYDNRVCLDTWSIQRAITLTGGSAGLRERIRQQGELLCALGGHILSDTELDTPIPTLLLSHDAVLVDEPLALRALIAGLAEDHLPRHTQQLLDLTTHDTTVPVPETAR